MTAHEDAAGAIAAGVADRLGLRKIPVHLKALTLLHTLLAKGSPAVQLALKHTLLAAVEDISIAFFDVDPEHGGGRRQPTPRSLSQP